MLKSLHVHNYRAFVHFDWQMPSTCALVGENGAGKSALVEVLWLLQDVVVHGRTVEETTAASARTAWLSESEQIVECVLSAGEESFRYRLTLVSDGPRIALRESLESAAGERLYTAADGKVELYGDQPTGAPRTTIPFDRRRSFLAALEPQSDNRRLVAFREAVRSIWAVKPTHAFDAAAVAESATLDRDLGNFANWYRARVGEDPEGVEALRDDLQSVLKGFSTLRLEPLSRDVKDLVARFTFGGRSHELSWSKLSDGQKHLIALYGLLRLGLPKASVIVLDEIENFVAAAEIQPWLHIVTDLAAEQGQQLIVVTHHPEAINYMAADAVVRMWRDEADGRACVEQLEPDRSAGETAYDLVKFGSVSDNGGRPV